MIGETGSVYLSEDPGPSGELTGDDTSVEDVSSDPTSLPEHDDSPEALQELLDAEAEVDVSVEVDLPKVKWGADPSQPDFAHSHTSASARLNPASQFEFSWRVFDLLVKANLFRPRGKNGLIAFGLRGGKLVGSDIQENVDRVQIEDTRPDHKGFNCTLGIFDSNTKKMRAYAGSTVPNKKWMQNYYKLKNGIRPHKSTRSNLLPTGCYIYRVNAHGGGRIKPALRMTDPDNLTADAICTVLRTHHDLTYSHDDFWDRSQPYDNIHCAYSNSSFSSAGCQTIKGPDGKGAWGAFQKVIGGLGWNARIDYVLLTGREAAIAAAIVAVGKDNDPALVQAALGRLRVGSEGEIVTALQKKLGFNGSAYFGPSTKKRLVEAEAARELSTDGIYSPADDLATGWGVFADEAAPAVDLGGATGGGAPSAAASNIQLSATPGGTAQLKENAQTNAITFVSASESDGMQIVANASLSLGGADVPLKITAEIEGIPAGSVGLEVTVAAVPLPAAPNTAGTPATPTTADTPKLTADTFDAFAPRARDDYRDAILQQGHAILGVHGIDANARRLAHFLAQVSHESGGFFHRIESLNYTSAARIHAMWPRRFPSVQSAEPFVRNEPGLAEKVYGGRMGNTQPGDGFKYRGRGMIQLTGRKNYQNYADRLGVDLVGQPDLAFAPETALRIAAEYWAQRKLRGERSMNALADDDKLRALTYRINGGFTNFEHREEELAKAKSIWGDSAMVVTDIVDRGDFSDAVRHLQLSLVSLGLLRGTVDGKFGFNTYKALFKFKSEAGLDGEGYADKATFHALNNPDFTESMSTEAAGDAPLIGDDPEPIRNGISLGEEDMMG
ncbi:peptidoglycan-binding protein [Ruegeria sp. 2205SS24-7]|uniref:peptidoglycan-binding protein n=1 Tax=Ruegeria discodermiae TaxID=3064389 RepID=UPI0027413740|nr:peptidoglycan-binding protein [Ruegeria sp. 2205SS24-7]MDP5215697.1 peptidoglycan-binding protein [Ruegeria sp. 2205SS24-7]